jgi:hypothetical protein
VAELLVSRLRTLKRVHGLFKLTQAPLELDNPAHLDVLLRAYERFPEIGRSSILESRIA